jgi:3'-5' exoribonuclease
MTLSKTYLADISEGDVVDSYFLVTSRQLEPFRNKPGHYLQLTLADKTGEIRAFAWDRAHEFYQIADEDQVVRAYGSIKDYRGNLQLYIESLALCEEGEFDLAELVPHVDKDIGELEKELFRSIDRVSNPFLRQLLNYFFKNPHCLKLFEKAPGGKRIHHGYLGGLLEHTVEVAKICEFMCTLFPEVDEELLLCGALLHDIGKIREYCYARRIDITDEGKLLGHIMIGDELVSEAINSISNFPADLAVNLRHMLISHHGELEWGSPKRPKTIEAIILHHVDNLDAKVNQFAQIISRHSDDGGNWSNYENTLGRSIYIGPDKTSFVEIGRSVDETAAGEE